MNRNLLLAGVSTGLISLVGCDKSVDFEVRNDMNVERHVMLTLPDGSTKDLGTVEPGETRDTSLSLDDDELPGTLTWRSGALTDSVTLTDDTKRVRVVMDSRLFARRITREAGFSGQMYPLNEQFTARSTAEDFYTTPTYTREPVTIQREAGYSRVVEVSKDNDEVVERENLDVKDDDDKRPIERRNVVIQRSSAAERTNPEDYEDETTWTLERDADEQPPIARAENNEAFNDDGYDTTDGSNATTIERTESYRSQRDVQNPNMGSSQVEERSLESLEPAPLDEPTND